MFKVGDKVVCVLPAYPLTLGVEYTVAATDDTRTSLGYFVQVAGDSFWYSAARFGSAPEPDETYVGAGLDVVWGAETAPPETPEAPERAAREKLRAYKREMRDWLYGTTSGDAK